MRRGHSASHIASAASRRASRPTSVSGASRRWPSSAIGSGCRGRNAAFSWAGMHGAAAGLIALLCWAGIAIQLLTSYSQTHDVLTTLWNLARFFTIIGNLAVAAAMSAVALGKRVSPLVLGGLTLAILLVGIVYA